MLEVNPETVCFIINKAQEFQTQEQGAFQDEPTDTDGEWSSQSAPDYQNDMSYQELKSTIEDLEPDQQVNLVALMWLGRGDFSVDEWEAALDQAKDNWNDRTADYLISTPLIADYLQEGLNQLGYSCD